MDPADQPPGNGDEFPPPTALPQTDGVTCPECGAAFEPEPRTQSGGFLECPRCGAQFLAPEPSDEAAGGDDSSDGGGGSAPSSRDAAPRPAVNALVVLSDLHIRAVTAERRATDRARSYCIIAAVGLWVAAVPLVTLAVYYLRRGGLTTAPIVYVVLASLAALAPFYFVARAVALTRELGRRPPEPDLPEPDFSTLSDGSQYARNLERVAGRDEPSHG